MRLIRPAKMASLLACGVWVLHAFRPLAASADGPRAAASSEGGFAMAAGTSLGFSRRADYGEGSSDRFFIEPLVHAYMPTPVERLFVRATLHASYMWDQNEMPQSLRVEESDTYFGLLAGVLFDWVLIPSFELGGQYIHRAIELKGADPITLNVDNISGSETLYAFVIQGGLGIPLFEGLLVLEPFLRQRFIPEDAREGVGYGMEVSVQFL